MYLLPWAKQTMPDIYLTCLVFYLIDSIFNFVATQLDAFENRRFCNGLIKSLIYICGTPPKGVRMKVDGHNSIKTDLDMRNQAHAEYANKLKKALSSLSKSKKKEGH